jgi:ribonucleoside-diphosphate reductase alpha chain
MTFWGGVVQTSQEISAKSTVNISGTPAVSALAPSSPGATAPLHDYKIIRRNGAVVGFEPSKISIATIFILSEPKSLSDFTLPRATAAK